MNASSHATWGTGYLILAAERLMVQPGTARERADCILRS